MKLCSMAMGTQCKAPPLSKRAAAVVISPDLTQQPNPLPVVLSCLSSPAPPQKEDISLAPPFDVSFLMEVSCPFHSWDHYR